MEQKEIWKEFVLLKNSKFKQNAFHAWKPSNKPINNFVIYLIFGIIFLFLGIIYIYFATQIDVVDFSYKGTTDEITVPISFPMRLEPPILVYYEISGLHQNIRRFAYSRSVSQLYGNDLPIGKLSSCKPVLTESDRLYGSSNNSKSFSKVANPCGLAAKYTFNDEIQLLAGDGTTIPINTTEIVFQGDKERYKKIDGSWVDMTSERFINWMKVSPMNPVKKLLGRINVSLYGNYTIVISNNYKNLLKDFNGKRSLIFSTTSFLGGPQYFLGTFLLVTGAIFLLISITYNFCIDSHQEFQEYKNFNAESKQTSE